MNAFSKLFKKSDDDDDYDNPLSLAKKIKKYAAEQAVTDFKKEDQPKIGLAGYAKQFYELTHKLNMIAQLECKALATILKQLSPNAFKRICDDFRNGKKIDAFNTIYDVIAPAVEAAVECYTNNHTQPSLGK